MGVIRGGWEQTALEGEAFQWCRGILVAVSQGRKAGMASTPRWGQGGGHRNFHRAQRHGCRAARSPPSSPPLSRQAPRARQLSGSEDVVGTSWPIARPASMALGQSPDGRAEQWVRGKQAEPTGLGGARGAGIQV